MEARSTSIGLRPIVTSVSPSGSNATMGTWRCSLRTALPFEDGSFDRALWLDAASRSAIQAAIDRDVPLLDAQRGGRPVVCHGDVHPGNVLQSDAGPVLLDWDLLCHGPAAWDHAPLMTWTQRWGGAPGIYESFADGYGRSQRGDDVAEAIAELRLVAATLMRLRAGRTDPVAMDEAQLRLRYWRGDADAPQWHPQ